jgi:hypothetical protein
VTETGDYRFFAGWRSDPFFCDVEGTKNNLQFTGDDFLLTRTYAASLLKCPTLPWGRRRFARGRTLVPERGGRGGWVQVDRGALPAQTNVLTGEIKDAYLAGAGRRRTFSGCLRALA